MAEERKEERHKRGAAKSDEEMQVKGEATPATTARARARDWMRPLRAGLPRLRKTLGRRLTRGPRIDVIERENEIIVRAEVPGIAKERIDAAVASGKLLIRATDLEPGEKERRAKLIARGFERRLALPCAVEAERASGSVRDGVLELVLPKSEHARRHAIAIR